MLSWSHRHAHAGRAKSAARSPISSPRRSARRSPHAASRRRMWCSPGRRSSARGWRACASRSRSMAARPESGGRRTHARHLGDARRRGLRLEIQHLAPVILERVNSHFGWRCAGKLAIRQGRVTGKAMPKPAPPSPILAPWRRGRRWPPEYRMKSSAARSPSSARSCSPGNDGWASSRRTRSSTPFWPQSPVKRNRTARAIDASPRSRQAPSTRARAGCVQIE